MPKRTPEEIIEEFSALLLSLFEEAEDEEEDEGVDDDEEAEDDDESEDDESEDEDDDEAEEEEDEEESDDEESEDDEAWDEESLAALDRDELKEVAEQWEIEFTAKTATKTLINKILEAQDAEGGDESEEEEDDEEPDDDSDEFWTAEELEPKPIGELRAIAKEYGVTTKGKNSAALIKAILAA